MAQRETIMYCNNIRDISSSHGASLLETNVGRNGMQCQRPKIKQEKGPNGQV